MNRRFILVYDVPNMGLRKGDIVYEFHGPTYGCIAFGIAVSRQPGETPFMEVPHDSVRPNLLKAWKVSNE